MCLALDRWHGSTEWMNDSEFVLSREAERERGQLGEVIPSLDGHMGTWLQGHVWRQDETVRCC